MRKSKPKKRILLPDPKFHDTMVTRFVNNLMLQGKKSIAYSIFYDAIDMVGEKMKDSDKAPLDILQEKRGHAQNGGGQQGICALPLLIPKTRFDEHGKRS